VHADGKCDIFYEDDGDSEERVAPRFVKVLLSVEERTRATAARAAAEEVRPDPMPTGKANFVRTNFERGQRVRAKFQGDIGGVNWFPGTVTAVHADGKCDIFYEDDGDSEERVAPRFVKVLLSVEEKRAAAAVLPPRTEKDEARGGGFALRDVCGIQGCPLPNNHPGLCQVLVTCSRRGKAVQPAQPAQPARPAAQQPAQPGASATAGSSKPASAPPAKRQRKSMPVDPAAANSLLASVSPRALSIGSGLRRVATAAFGRALNKVATGR